MANAINNIKDVGSIVSKMSAGMLEDQFQFIKTVDKEEQSSFGQTNGFNHGDTINISKPARFEMGTSADITSSIQDVTEEKVPLVLDKQRNIPIALTSSEIATDLSLKSWANRILKPAMSRLAQGIEAECLELASDAVYNSVGSAGSTAFDPDTMLSARERLMKNLCPFDGDTYALLDSTAMRSAVNARKGLFNGTKTITKQNRTGAMEFGDGFKYLENNLLPLHTNGNDVAFEVRTTVSTEGETSIVVEGLTTTTGTVTKGTVFTIAGVNAVHGITKEDLGYEQQFTVTADATADGTGYATLSVSPAIYTSASAGLQNVTAFPADGDTITPVGAASTAYTQNLAYHKSAFRFVSVPLVTPNGTHMSSQSTVNGITVRAVQDYDVNTDKLIMRLDVLYGFATVRPEWAARITA
jgi:hypothetical protein